MLPACSVRHPAERFCASRSAFGKMPNTAGWKPPLANPHAMNPLPISQIAEFAGALLSSGNGRVTVDKINTDSRTLKRGELFVALRGENFDGHKLEWKRSGEFRAHSGQRHIAGLPKTGWQLPEVARTTCDRDYRKQWQNKHERFYGSSARPPSSSHKNGRKFQ